MQRRAKPPERALPGQACHLQQPGQHRIVGHKAEVIETGEPDIDGQHHRHHELIDAHETRPAFHRQHFLHQLLELQLLQHGGHREKSAIRGKILAVKVERSRTCDFIGFWSNCWRALLGAGFAAMLLFVLHLLGDLLEIGSRSCELRRLSVLQQDFQGPQRVLFLRASSALQTLCIGQVQPLATNAVGGFPEHDQRFLDRLLINPAHRTRLGFARRLSRQHSDRMLTVIPGHLGELIQDHLLADSIRCLITLFDGCCQFSSCGQSDPSPHSRLPAWVHAGSIYNEATTHLSVAILMSQCAWLKHHRTYETTLSTFIAQELAKRYSADPSAADWRRFGRLPGFTNCKPKYRKSNGLYPYVLLRSATGVQYRQATYLRLEMTKLYQLQEQERETRAAQH